MTPSPFLRHRNAILAAALAVAVLALLTAMTLNAVEQLSGLVGPACHRLLPRAPAVPRPSPWRIGHCLTVRSAR